jgi:hypothetical protein
MTLRIAVSVPAGGSACIHVCLTRSAGYPCLIDPVSTTRSVLSVYRAKAVNNRDFGVFIVVILLFKIPPLYELDPDKGNTY